MLSLTQIGFCGFLTGLCCFWSLHFDQGFPPDVLDIVTNYPLQINLPLLALQISILSIVSFSIDRAVISFTGFFLGLGFLLGVLNYQYPFGIYLAVLAFFHFSEFATTGLTNPVNLSFDSYLVNHSVHYGIAAALSWTEHVVLVWLVPGIKDHRLVSLCGLGICVVGEILRKLAMFHAGNNFNHTVQHRKDKKHVLVTSGVYGWFRHPSYVGWFLWSVGTQIILINPICLIIYTIVTWLFFKERIYVEEYNLIQFFGDEYRQYQSKVGLGIPGIKGFRVEDLSSTHED